MEETTQKGRNLNVYIVAFARRAHFVPVTDPTQSWEL